MLIPIKLPWEDYGWKDFERIGIKIAQIKFPNCMFQEYLKHGNKQEGIDLLSFNYDDGKTLTVQCKKVTAITELQLEKIIAEFLAGDFAQNGNTFILLTTADLNKPKLAKKINTYKELLKKQYHTHFESWDQTTIDDLLKEYRSIVRDHFGEGIADLYCDTRISETTFNNITKVEDYIPRTLFTREEIDRFGYLYETKTTSSLEEKVTEEISCPKKFILLGDAYMGKSTYLRQTAYLINTTRKNVKVILAEIKVLNIQKIENILTENYGGWKSIPYYELILFIDGLDEAPSDQFIEILKNINTFCKQHPTITTVVSCRAVFYESYEAWKFLTGFDVLYLNWLSGPQIQQYVEMKLGIHTASFFSQTDTYLINGILNHPFYLIQLCNVFTSGNTIPQTKAKVIDLFVKEAKLKSGERQIEKGRLLKHKINSFMQAALKLALGLQLAEKNSFSSEELQELLNTEEISLLEHHHLVNIKGDHWSFTNAMFQEHFAARMLKKLSPEKILSFCTVGSKVRKIKLKWLQTIASLIEITEPADPTYNYVVNFILEHDYEYLFQTEKSKFSAEFRFQLLQRLVSNCLSTNTRPILIHDQYIANFIEDIPQAIAFLYESLQHQNISYPIQYELSRILKYLIIPHDLRNKALSIITNELFTTKDAYYASQLLEIIIRNELFDNNFIQKISVYPPLKNNHEYRSEVYRLITVAGLHDEYYAYGIEGIPIYFEYNREISHGESETNLENFFLATRTRKNIRFLLQQLLDSKWLDHAKHRNSFRKTFIKRLMDVCSEIYRKDPFIVFDITNYVKSIGKKYLRNEILEVDEFLEHTSTHWIVVRLLMNDMLSDINWEIGSLITPETYDYVLFEFEEGKYDLNILRNILSGLRYKKNEQNAEDFFKRCDDLTQGTLYNRDRLQERIDYQQLEEQRRKNDKKYIQSQTGFKKGLIKFFEAYGKKTIPEEDFYVESDMHIARRNADSSFIFHLLQGFKKKNSTLRLNTLLKYIDNEEQFEFFRAIELLEYDFAGTQEETFYLDILKNYYIQKINTVSFENCYWSEGTHYKFLRLPKLLGDLFQKYKFPTDHSILMEMIWLDQSGLKKERMNNAKDDSISDMIIKEIPPHKIPLLKERILSHLKTGIRDNAVLESHIALCGEFEIKEATYIIEEIIQEKRLPSYRLPILMKIYLTLGGSIDFIKEKIQGFEEYNEYYFMELCELIEGNYPLEIKEILQNILSNPQAISDTKISAAKKLITMGDINGLKFMVAHVGLHKKAPYTIQGKTSIKALDTATALTEIKPIMHLIGDSSLKNQRSFHESAPNIILEWLSALSSKSEDDMILVTNSLFQTEKEMLDAEMEGASDLHFYANRMVEDFRSLNETKISFRDIKNILLEIDY